MSEPDLLLAGDVGGTKTMLGLYSVERGPRRPLARETFESDDFDDLPSLCRRFIDASGAVPRRAVFGVPGPVRDGRARATNLPWEIDARGIGAALGIEEVELFNDLVGLASALPELASNEVRRIAAGQPRSGGNIGVLAVGTGLGEAFLTHDARAYTAHASEGGHADFAPTSEVQDRLLAFLRARHGRVSYERVCSGLGIPNLYDFLRESGAARESDWLAEELENADDRTPLIVEAGLSSERRCPLCRMAVELFASILGAKAGNLALEVLATGGVYLGGGIAPRVVPVLETPVFEKPFRDKGRLSGLLASIPVYVVLAPDAAIIGVARRGLQGG